jgi:hemerythrin-like domain-containing protein
MRRHESRRDLIGAAGLALAGGLVAPAMITRRAHAEELESMSGKADENEAGGKVTPPEDLMREHGVLDRVLLIYEAVMRRFGSGEDFDPSVIADSAKIVREFIEDYHEKLEEDYVFPRFKEAGKMDRLIGILLDQHKAGRRITDVILKFGPDSRKDADARRQVVAAMQGFIAMYRPHAAREDTVVFPRLQGLVSANEYDAMAEDFKKKEHDMFGDDGFYKMVHRVAAVEQALGIWDLSQFTPR